MSISCILSAIADDGAFKTACGGLADISLKCCVSLLLEVRENRGLRESAKFNVKAFSHSSQTFSNILRLPPPFPIQ